MALTIYDIAELAGVSITTVSRVLNGKGYVSEKTKNKVQEVLDQQEYTPSQLARGLANKNSKIIGIVTVDIRDSHHSSISYQVEQVLQKQGYSSLVCNLGGDKKRISEYLDTLMSHQADGIVFVGSIFMDEICAKEMERYLSEIPVVIVNGILPFENVYGIVEKEKEACIQVVEYLVSRKKMNIVLAYDEDTVSAHEKEEGYEMGMNQCGLPDRITKQKTVRTLEGGIESAKKIMRETPKTNAIFYTEDICAAGGLKALLEMGYRVPEEVAVVGFNNSIYANICHPSLTSVDNKLQESGEIAAQLLLDVLAGKKREKLIKIPCELVVRQST